MYVSVACAYMLNHLVVSDSATPGAVAHQAPLSMGFSRQEYWSEWCHFLLQGIFPTQGSNPYLLWRLWQADSLSLSHTPSDI